MNLAETQEASKKFVAIAIILIIAFYVGKFAFVQGKRVYYIFFPKTLAAPEAKFGKLPKLTMSPIQVQGTPKYELETKDGKLPAFSDRAVVYAFREPKPSLLNEQRTKDLAKGFEFTGDFKKTSASQFNWVDGTNNRAFNGDAVSGSFALTTQIAKLESVLSNTPSITENDAKEEAQKFLQSKGLVEQIDIDSGEFTTIPTLVTIGRLRESRITPQDTKIIKVDLHRRIVLKTRDFRGQETVTNTVKIAGPNPKNSLISVMVTNDQKAFKYPIVSFTYWPVDRETYSEYPLSDITAVWQAVTEQKGITAYLKPAKTDYFDATKPQTVDRISIRDITLAYYEPKEFTKYLQPVYVFEGKYWIQNMPPGEEPGEIVIYFPAVRGDYVE